MSDITILKHLQYAPQASATDHSSTPGSLKFLEPINQLHLDPRYLFDMREGTQRGNGGKQPRERTVKDSSFFEGTPAFHQRGLSGAGAGDGVSTSTLNHDFATIYTHVFGASVDGVGDTFDATPGSGTTLTMNGTAGQVDGQGVVILGNTSGKLQLRQVTSSPTSTIVIDRALTTDAGAADTPTASSVAYGARTYSLSKVAPDRAGIYFRGEGENFRRDIFSASGNMIFDYTGGLAVQTLDGWQCTNWTAPADENPTYALPDRGSIIVSGGDCQVHLGASLYRAYGITVNVGQSVVPRTNQGGVNGRSGHVFAMGRPTISMTLGAGTQTAPNEVTDAVLDTLRSNTSYDVLIQIGRTLGGIVGFRAPACRFVSANRIAQDGLIAIQCELEVCDASAVANNPLGTDLQMMLA
jgi:hypothetical protein